MRAHASIVAMLEATAGEFPRHAAVVFGDTTWTYADLRRIVVGLARYLGSGGGRIATLLPNSLLACATPYAAAAAGAQLVPLNPLYTARELEYMLRDAAPRLLVVDDALVERVQPVLGDCTLLRASELAARFPAWLAQDDEALLLPDPDGEGLLQYTGGSSGFPKGVILTHRALATNVAQRDSLLPVAPGGERVLCVMPLFHSYAMAMGLFLCGHSGSTLVVQPGYHPERLLEAIVRERITIFPGSPTIFTGLMQHAAFAHTDWSRVHTCYSGSAALSRETLERWQSATGAPIYEGYGQTEAGPVLSFNPARGPVKVGSVGVAVADTELQVVDLEEGTRVLPAGERGEIRARGPQLMRGYLNLPAETAEALRDGWLYTGDIGEFDADGYLYIRDRKKDLVIVGGYNVYPREVEEVLFTHPDVAEAAVVGQPDAYRGEILRAFVVLRPERAFDEEALKAFCAERLARYKVPARIEALEALPKTSVNKTDKKVLKARVRA
ncbi:AMP-binding protein [Ramlibacter sp. USB13]|uniref:AMP-binding protein n=1 Tax=Ramlibacter cellulosilyticus TaxID=2764187 RepID=A0A923SBE3_9BURK|nr:AMP-binding protein [Ramlibacter cellulosilyticus]MBC5783775.1 AMP-binding protein [Ramlibacter cellulosilyticus]